MLLTFICGGLPPKGDVGVRVREIMRAFILVSAPEYQQKPYGEILNIILRIGGAIKHMAGDKSSQFSNVHTYLVDVDVLRNEASTAVSHMEQDKEGIRIDINTQVLEVVNLQTFLDLNLVVNNTEIPPPGLLRTRSDMWYTANQDHYYRTPGNTSQEGDHSNLLNEEQLQRLCGHMYDFAKQVGYGLRTYNREVDSSASSDSGMINIHQLAMMMKRMPESMDHPLGFALNSLQAFAICLHVIHSYTSWREYETERPYYRWSENIVSGTDIKTLSYLEHRTNAVCELYTQNGLQLPPAFKQHAWNQMGVESGYVADCVRKRDALQIWEHEFTMMDAPPPLVDGDGRFPPKLQAHPNWVYETGRIATPWASNLEPEGLRPATQAADPWEMDEDEPMATNAPAPWDRTEASSSSQQPPPRHQPEVEPVRDAWEEVPIPPGAQQHTFVFHKPDNTMCRSVLLAEERDINSYPRSIDETPKFVDNPSSGTAPIEHYVRRLVTYLARLQSVTQTSEKGLNLKAYVELDTKQWLRMYSRIHHACEIAACIHLPDPVMLTAAAI